MLPKDSVMLLSFVNMKLRDFYPDLDEFCKDYNITPAELSEEMKKIDYVYSYERNQFV